MKTVGKRIISWAIEVPFFHDSLLSVSAAAFCIDLTEGLEDSVFNLINILTNLG